MVGLGERISRLRKERGWSQEELAGRLEVTRQSISKWESGSSVPDLEKILRMGELFGVSTDFLLKEGEEAQTAGRAEEVRSVSREEAEAYLSVVERLAPRKALAVALFILSPVVLFLLQSGKESGIFPLSSGLAEGIGLAVLLGMVAAGVGLLILSGLPRYDYLEEREIALSREGKEWAKSCREGFRPRFQRGVAAGVVLCILGAAPVVLAGSLDAGEPWSSVCFCMLLILVAGGVYGFVRHGVVYNAYAKLLQEGEYTRRQKELNRRFAYLPGVYWCLATALYLGISFLWNSWDTSWIVWPVAGVLYAALLSLLYGLAEARGRKEPKSCEQNRKGERP